MKVLGIDPGSAKSGWVALGIGNAGMRVSDHDYCPNEALLHMLRAMTEGDYQGVGVEWIQSQGRKHVGNETFDTQGWAGRFLEAAYPVPAAPIPRRKVIGHLVGSYGGDAQVIQALQAKPGLDCGSVTGHCWQALAVAVTFVEVVAVQGAATP